MPAPLDPGRPPAAARRELARYGWRVCGGRVAGLAYMAASFAHWLSTTVQLVHEVLLIR